METKETRCHPKSAVNATCLLGNKGCYENGKCHYMGNCEHKVLTNADRIRAMSDEELATQLVQVFKEGIKVLTDMDMPEELLDKFWNSFLERLKQPADMKGEEDG